MKEFTKIKRLILTIRRNFITEGPNGDRKRGKLYEPYLKSCGKNFKLGTNAFIYNPNGMVVGNDVYIGFNSYIGQGKVFLDDEVLIGNFVSITPSNHLRKENSFRFGGYHAESIRIGKGTWIGAHACILASVEIGSGCLIAAGSVVTKTIKENNKLIAGVPARIIKNLDEK